MVQRPQLTGHGIPDCLRGHAQAMLALGFLLVFQAAPGCNHEQTKLDLDQLHPGERRYIERIVTLERAKAVALVQRAEGTALLDSLAVAWGDSARTETLADAPVDPIRAQLVNELLNRILEAEQDSLVEAPRPDRLHAPLPSLP